MNKKANIMSVTIMAFLLFSVGFIVANFLKSPIDDARVSLDCTNAAVISDGTKLMCLSTDLTMIYFIILILSISMGVILDKVLI
jgi:hypothetical protein